jgi:hypothetical protein
MTYHSLHRLKELLTYPEFVSPLVYLHVEHNMSTQTTSNIFINSISTFPLNSKFETK